MKKMRIMMVVVALVGILAPVDTLAAPDGLYTCTVNLAGTKTKNLSGWSTDRIVITMTDQGGIFSQYPFLASVASDKQVLATAMTALVAGNTVQAYVVFGKTYPGYGDILALYINQ